MSQIAPFKVDLDRLLMDENQPVNPLYRNHDLNLQLVTARDGYAQLSVVLPVEMTRHFAQLLDTLSGLFRSSDRKARIRIEAQKLVDLDHQLEAKKRQQDFAERVCSLFDQFSADGCSRNMAISRTNQALKAEKHPWASYSVVQQTLRDHKRLRKAKRSNGSK